MGKKRVDSDDEGDSTETPQVKTKGYNYAAIALMLMFGLPILLAFIVQVKIYSLASCFV